jgi:hypothetical protein
MRSKLRAIASPTRHDLGVQPERLVAPWAEAQS